MIDKKNFYHITIMYDEDYQNELEGVLYLMVNGLNDHDIWR
jgi:hypothetical protein